MTCTICGASHSTCGGAPLALPPLDLERPMADTTWTADRRLYLDAHGNVVEADNPARVTLLVPQGGRLSMADAARYGLLEEPKSAPKPVNKARRAPPNKAQP